MKCRLFSNLCPSGSGPAQYYQYADDSQERALERVGCVPCTGTDFSVVRLAPVLALQAHDAWLGKLYAYAFGDAWCFDRLCRAASADTAQNRTSWIRNGGGVTSARRARSRTRTGPHATTVLD